MLVAMCLLVTSGCIHRVVIQTDPPGADAQLRDRALGPTPVEITTLVLPLRKIPVTVSLEGYRTVEVHLEDDVGLIRALGDLVFLRWGRLVGLVPRTDHSVVLMPEHGPAGTWTPDDARSR